MIFGVRGFSLMKIKLTRAGRQRYKVSLPGRGTVTVERAIADARPLFQWCACGDDLFITGVTLCEIRRKLGEEQIE